VNSTIAITLGLSIVFVPALARSLEEPPPLSLDEVLRSVRNTFPLLDAARSDRSAAEGKLMAARGGFDTRLSADGDLRPAGFYENYAGGLAVEQPTRLWGARFFGAYRVGRGKFPSYEGGRQTNDGGEIGGGFEVPLLRGGPIDEPRAALQNAELDRLRVEPEIELQRVRFLRDASLSYWNWVAAGRGVEVAKRLLSTARARQEQLESRVARGIVPRIELVDNERLIVDRAIRLTASERDAQMATIGLSLFLRTADGQPILVASGRLPPRFPPEEAPDPAAVVSDIELASLEHPRLRALSYQIESADVALRLARNQSLPALDLRLVASNDFGGSVQGISSEGTISPNPRGDTEFKALVRLELPVLRREARGMAQVAEARKRRLEAESRYLRDQIETRIRSAMATLEAAYSLTAGARRNLELASKLESAENRKLSLGTSNLINVNIRELQTAEANLALIEAQAEYFRALADYRAAVALDRVSIPARPTLEAD